MSDAPPVPKRRNKRKSNKPEQFQPRYQPAITFGSVAWLAVSLFPNGKIGVDVAEGANLTVLAGILAFATAQVQAAMSINQAGIPNYQQNMPLERTTMPVQPRRPDPRVEIPEMPPLPSTDDLDVDRPVEPRFPTVASNPYSRTNGPKRYI